MRLLEFHRYKTLINWWSVNFQ